MSDFAQSIRDAVSASDVDQRAINQALWWVLNEQPCTATGSFGHVSDLKPYRCARLWHDDINHDWRDPESVENGCQQITDRFRASRTRCGHPLVDGKCTVHDPV